MLLGVKFVITGNPPIKKNAKRILFNRRTHRPFIMSSEKYLSWEEDALLQIKAQWKGETITQPVNAEMKFYLPTRRKTDLSNLYQGPEDTLQKAGVIEDDYLIASHDGSRRFYDKENPRVEVTLTEYLE